MTEEPKLDDPFTEEELAEGQRIRLAFHIEAARAGMFAATSDIAEEVKQVITDPRELEIIILTACAEFTAQLWQQRGHRMRVPMQTARKSLLKQIQQSFSKYVRRTRVEEVEAKLTAAAEAAEVEGGVPAAPTLN